MKGESIEGAAIRMTDADNVATALEDLSTGRELAVDGGPVELLEDVAFGHKFALEPLSPGDPVVKYGEVIGEATAAIEPGEWVHVHNVESRRGRPSERDGAEVDEA